MLYQYILACSDVFHDDLGWAQFSISNLSQNVLHFVTRYVELALLKDEPIAADKLRKAAGKPRNGPSYYDRNAV
jgi:hypothetical protein